ncbi:IS66 family transposase [Paracoccus benzoatiresistens]|uniref:IS66 family transposase n=1 Tax=Paracoccus benzoatiresistens TaxID=2997341 RepID=UPI00352FEF6F
MGREGLDPNPSALADWVAKTTALLEPLADAIGRHVLSIEVIFADDTPVQMLAPGTGRTRTARLGAYARDERPWSGMTPPAAWYRLWATARASTPRTISLASAAGCMPTAMPASRISTVPAPFARSPGTGPYRAQVRRHPPIAGLPIAEEAIGRIA